MALVKRKTRKAIRKQLTKVIEKHGPEIATGIATGLMSSIVALITPEKLEGDGHSTAEQKSRPKPTGTPGQSLLTSIARIPAVQEIVQMLAEAGQPEEAPHAKKKLRKAPVDLSEE
jgi:hypothetical protein